jgi:hypothetical protein
VDEDTPDNARVSLPVRDVRDLVRLIPCLRAAIAMRDLAAHHIEPALQLAIQRFDAERLV